MSDVQGVLAERRYDAAKEALLRAVTVSPNEQWRVRADLRAQVLRLSIADYAESHPKERRDGWMARALLV
jgi:hypothetical protein